MFTHRSYSRCRRLRAARLVPLALLLFLPAYLWGVALLNAPPARAQAESGKLSANTSELLNALADIDYLTSLNPLKLTPEQLDKLIALMTTAQADYDKKVNAMGESLLAKMTEEIRRTKERALAGSPVPEDFKKRVVAAENDFLKRRAALNNTNIERIGQECMNILTAKQISLAVSIAKEGLLRHAQPDPRNKTSQYFNMYVLQVLISNPRCIPLLKEMRAAAEGRAAGAGGGTEGKTGAGQ